MFRGLRSIGSLALVAFALSQAAYVERECPCTLGTLWVDVAVAIDLSAGMTPAGAVQVVADLASVFAQSQISQTQGTYSRVGIITYTSNYTTVYPMEYFTSQDQFMNEIWNLIPQSTPDTTSDIKNGLAGAYGLLNRPNPDPRATVQRAILIYASDYNKDGQDDPIPLSNQIKTAGIKIITASFNQGGEERVLDGLKQLASPGMAFANTDQDITGEIQQALCQTNCFCPNTWRQYANDFNNPVKSYGQCIKFGDIAAVWTPAKYSCQQLKAGGYLATEFNSGKHNFLFAMAKADTTFTPPHDFHIGLSYNTSSGNWVWEQGMGKAQINQQQFSGWLPGYPSTPIGSNTCALNTPKDTSESGVGWKNINCNSVSKRYACQVNTCDTDTYCATMN